ncbi:MAG TPA: MurT ligase domain-containing protein [Marmoricola sp.]
MDFTMPSATALPPSARLTTALAAARTAGWLSRRLTGGGGRAIAGRTLMRLDPSAPRALAQGRRITLVTGTNGKTTTTAMLAAALGRQSRLVTNRDGANTPTGLVTTLAERGPETVVLEVDEGWLPWAVEVLKPVCVVLLNLSRDQLHRHPEVHRLANAWRQALTDVPLVVANADDPAIVWAADTAQQRIWVAAGQTWTQDSMVCPSCGDLLKRPGESWSSCACGFRRPTPAWSASDGSLRHHGQRVLLAPGVPGDVNLGNAALAVAAATAAGVEPTEAARAVGSVRDVAGRYAEFVRGRQTVRLFLAKNPAGWDAALRALAPSSASLVLAFNADGVDGRDPSWLYDVGFDRLAGRTVAVCGRRGTDMLVRLRLDGINPVGQFDTIDGALRALPSGPVDVVGNYTAFQEARRVLGHVA